MQLCAILYAVFLSLLARAVADVSITSPGIGQSFSASGGQVTIKLSWEAGDDSSGDTSLDDVLKYAIALCTGPNGDIQNVATLTDSLSKSSTSYLATLQSSDYPNGIYYFQVYTTFPLGYTIHYSPRFKLTNMGGDASTVSFKPSLLSVTGDAPTAQMNVGENAVTTTADSKWFTVPYTEQTGKTRYAPMQTQPASSISYKLFSNRHLLSAYTPYLTMRASPNVFSTITPGWNYTPASKVNTAPVAAYPSSFYPASSRVTSASLSSANKKRWI